MLPENLRYFPVPAVSDYRIVDAPHADATPIVTGELHGGAHYAVWRTRGTRDWLLLFTCDGRGRIGHADGEFPVESGQIVLLRPGTRHDYGTARGATYWNILWAHFLPHPHWLDWLRWPEPAMGVLTLRLDGEIRPRIETALRTMNRYATGAGPAGRSLRRRDDFARHALEEALLWCESVTPSADRLDPRVARAMAYLRERLAEPVTLPETARAAGLSVSRLAHVFKSETGLTPMQYREAERIGRARQLLALTNRSVAAIAAEVGFESPIHFSLRFKKQVGVSPRDYRVRHVDR